MSQRTETKKIIDLDLDKGVFGEHKLGCRVSRGTVAVDLGAQSDGYKVTEYDGRIASFFLCFENGYEGYSVFEGAIVVDGKRHYLGKDSSYSEIVRILGEPRDSWNDGVEFGAEYERYVFEIEVIWRAQDVPTLKHLSVLSK